MSTELVKSGDEVALVTGDDRPWELRGFQDAEWLAKTLAKSSLVPTHFRGKPADIFLAIVQGHELDLRPMQALQGSWAHNGVLSWRAHVLVGVVKRSPLCEYFMRVSSDETQATYETKRKGEPSPVRFTFTVDMAKRAKLTGKDNWQGYTQQMCMARASTALARDVYPDVVGGLYDPDEIDGTPEPVAATGTTGPVAVEIVPLERPAEVVDRALETHAPDPVEADPVAHVLASIPTPPAE